MKTTRRIFAILMAVTMMAMLAFAVSAAPVQETYKDTFVESFTVGAVRNNFHSWIGMLVRVGDHDITVTALGRLFYEGNTQEHQIKLVDAETNTDVSGALTTVNGGTVGQFTYGQLETPVTLKANHTYYLMSLENYEGDYFAEADYQCFTSAGAECMGPVYYLPDSNTYHPTELANRGFVGLDFKYEMTTDKIQVTDEREMFTEVTLSATKRSNFTSHLGTMFTVGNKDIYVTELGRIFVAGNSQPHLLRIIDAATKATVPGSTITVQGGTDGKFTYGKLATPIKLTAGKTYYIVSSETEGGDVWYEGDTALVGAEGITVTGSAFLLPEGFVEAPNNHFVPTSMKFGTNVSTVEETPGDNSPQTGDPLTIAAGVLFLTSGAALTVCGKKKF